MFLSVRPVGLFSRFLRREPQQQRDATRRLYCRRILPAAPDCVRAFGSEGGRPGLFGNSRRLQRKFPYMSAGCARAEDGTAQQRMALPICVKYRLNPIFVQEKNLL